MLGWHISVFRQADGGSSPAKAGPKEDIRLAAWQTGVEGLQWLDALVETGQAIDLGGNGYPNYYTAQAAHLIPQIVGGPPAARQPWLEGQHDVVTSQWEGKTVIDQAVAGDCRSDEWLLVVAWDES
jgi:hypothetical protein